MRSILGSIILAILWCGRVTQGDCPSNDVPEEDLHEVYASMEYSVADFSFSMLRVLSGPSSQRNERGLFFSPFSVWSSIALLYLGAQGSTEAELAKVLRANDKASISQAYHNLQQSLRTNLAAKNTTYRLANRLFFSTGAKLEECFSKRFPEEIAQLNFKDEPEESRGRINQWVERETEDKIHDLIPPDSISSFTQLVVANAVYFRGNWMQMFDPKFTKRLRFTTSDLKVIFADTMYLRSSFYFAISDELRLSIIELPYAGKEMSMLILLPHNYVSGLKRLIQSLTPELLGQLTSTMYYRDVAVYVPKFRIESDYEMSEPLKRMGLRDLFDPRKADLSGFTGEKDVSVDAVHHKGYIDVTEEGTEAAAATGFLASRTARPLNPAAFIADRPFLFLIKDNLFNLIVFAGTVTKPEYP